MTIGTNDKSPYFYLWLIYPKVPTTISINAATSVGLPVTLKEVDVTDVLRIRISADLLGDVLLFHLHSEIIPIRTITAEFETGIKHGRNRTDKVSNSF